MGTHRRPNASVAGIWPISSLKGKVLSPGGRSGQIFEIFEILGWAGDIYNSISVLNYCDGPYIHLALYANKVRSAWTELWSSSYRSRARFCLPGVVLSRFRDF